MAISPVLAAAQNYQQQLARMEGAANQRLINAYVHSWRRLEGMLDGLLLDIGDNIPTQGQLVRMARYQALTEQIAAELAGLQGLTSNEIEAAGQLVGLGELHSRELIGITMGDVQIAGAFNTLPRSAIQMMLGFLDPNGPLFNRLRQLASVNAQYVADAMIEGITLGYNPRKIARMVRDAFARGLADALRFIRTAQLWAYREASRASMIVNRDVVTGWVWFAHFDDRVCMSCVAMHGTIHEVDEPLNDHHNGRCARVPLVQGFGNPVEQTGVDWFEQQDQDLQRHLMGPGKYKAWQEGRISLGQLTYEYDDDVYGKMRGEPSLKSLLEALLP